MYKVEFLKDLGQSKKGDVTEMFKSTAEALESKKIVKIVSKKDASEESKQKGENNIVNK